MRVAVLMERSVTDATEIEVKSLEELKEIMDDACLLANTMREQREEWEEVCGDCYDVRFENPDGKSQYVIENDKVIIKEYDGMM